MEQVGQVPVVGRREGVVVVVLLLVFVLVLVLVAVAVGFCSVARKCVARQVRWEILLHDGEGQMRVLAPEDGMAEEQRVQVWGVQRRVLLFSNCGLRGVWVTSRAWMPFGASASTAGAGAGPGAGRIAFFFTAVGMPSAIPTQSPSRSPLPPSSSRCWLIQRVQTRYMSSA